MPENFETGLMNFSACDYSCDNCFSILKKDTLIIGDDLVAQGQSFVIESTAFNFDFQCNIDFSSLIFVNDNGFGFSPDNAFLRGSGNLEISGEVPEIAPVGVYDIVYDLNNADCAIFCQDCFEVVGYISTNESELNNVLHIYPNPAKEMLYINLFEQEDYGNVLIYNSLGQMTFAKNTIEKNVFSIDISKYETGIYHFFYASKKKNYVARFVVQ